VGNKRRRKKGKIRPQSGSHSEEKKKRGSGAQKREKGRRTTRGRSRSQRGGMSWGRKCRRMRQKDYLIWHGKRQKRRGRGNKENKQKEREKNNRQELTHCQKVNEELKGKKENTRCWHFQGGL